MAAKLWFFFFFTLNWVVQGSVVSKTEKECVTLSVPEEEIRLIRETSQKLNKFLHMNLEKGHQTLNKILSGFGVSKAAPIKVDPEEPLESFLLQYLIAMHLDTRDRISHVQELLQQGATREHNDVSNSDSAHKSFREGHKSKLDFVALFNVSSDASLGQLKEHTKYDGYRPTDIAFRPTDCSELLVAGHTETGIYPIYPFRCRCSEPVEVFCDMDTDGGGWTVFLLRNNISKPINFTRNWEDYKKGFGNPRQEYWLGNEHLHSLTFNRNYILRLEAKDGFGREIWGQWDTFIVDNEENNYKLQISKHNAKSSAFDRSSNWNEKHFTTFDRDNDKYAKGNCAEMYKGGWWYNACHVGNPTGIHKKQDNEGIQFNPWSKTDSTVRYATWTQFKIRPAICNSLIATANLNTHNCN